MAQMTPEQLNKHIETQVIPLIKETIGTIVSDLVQEQLAKSSAPPLWTKHFFADEKSEAEKPARAKGVAFGRIVRATAIAKKQGGGVDFAEKLLTSWGDADLAKALVDTQTKALAASVATDGGFLVPPEYSTDVIELRRAATVVRRLGPREIGMTTGTLNIPKQTAGATGSYIGENTNITKSQPTVGNVTLTWKKLAVLVPFSNDLLRYAAVSADAFVRDDIVRSLAVTEDAALLRSDGTAGQPKGLRFWAPGANLIAANGTVSLANTVTDFGKLILQLKKNNVPITKGAWILSPRTEFYLQTVQNANGYFAFRDEMVQRQTIWGYPYAVSTSVPETLTSGSNTDASEVYFVNFDDAVIGDSQRLIIDVSSEAAYHDGSSVVAAFSQDQTVVRAIAEHDFAMRDVNAVALLTGVRMGV